MKRRSFLKGLFVTPLIPAITKVAEYLPEPIKKRFNLSDLVAKTMQQRDKEIADNITNHNALLNYLRDRPNPPDMPESASWYDDRRGL